jgi:hypothetical protein
MNAGFAVIAVVALLTGCGQQIAQTPRTDDLANISTPSSSIAPTWSDANCVRSTPPAEPDPHVATTAMMRYDPSIIVTPSTSIYSAKSTELEEVYQPVSTRDMPSDSDPTSNGTLELVRQVGSFSLWSAANHLYLVDVDGNPVPQGQGRLRAVTVDREGDLLGVFRSSGNYLVLRKLDGKVWSDVANLAWSEAVGYGDDIAQVSAGKQAIVVTAGFTTPAGNSHGVGLFSFDGGKSWDQQNLPLFGSMAVLGSEVYLETGFRNRGNGSVIRTSNGSDWDVAFTTPFMCKFTRYRLSQNDDRSRLLVQSEDGKQYSIDPDKPTWVASPMPPTTATPVDEVVAPSIESFPSSLPPTSLVLDTYESATTVPYANVPFVADRHFDGNGVMWTNRELSKE